MRRLNIILSFIVVSLGICSVVLMYRAGSSGEEDCADEAQAATKTIVHKEQVGQWSYECETDSEGHDTCYGYQRIEDENGDNILSVRLSLVSRDGDILPRIKIIAPMGAFLPTGVNLYFAEEEPFTVPFQFCLTEDNGCFINLDLGRDVIKIFRETQQFYIGYKVVGGRDVRNTISVHGFDDVVRRLTQRLSEQTVLEEGDGIDR